MFTKFCKFHIQTWSVKKYITNEKGGETLPKPMSKISK